MNAESIKYLIGLVLIITYFLMLNISMRKKQLKSYVLNPEEVLTIISEIFEMSGEEILKQVRKPNYVIARRMYMKFTYQHIISDHTQTGIICGNRDRVTAIHHINKFNDDYSTDKEFREKYNQIISSIESNNKINLNTEYLKNITILK